MAQFINHLVKVHPAGGVTGKWSTKTVWDKVAQVKRAIRDSYFRAIGRKKNDAIPEEVAVQSQSNNVASNSALRYHALLRGYRTTITAHAQKIQNQVVARGALRHSKNGPFGRDFLWRRVRTGHLIGFATLFLVHEENQEEQAQSMRRWEGYDRLCENIKATFADDRIEGTESLIPPKRGYDLAEYELSDCIAVGSNGAVCEAKLVDNIKSTSTDKQKVKKVPRAKAGLAQDGTYGNKKKSRMNKKTQKLAVKMIFNFDSSNAGAIHRLTKAELVTCGRGAMSGLSKDWQNGTRARMKRLPQHPNVIKVERAVIGKIPEQDGFGNMFPDALPHPVGLGRSSTMFLVMKRYECTLEDYLKNHKLGRVCLQLLALQLLEGVAHLERNNVAHRDLKANNIFIEHDSVGLPRLVIGDFGCSFIPGDDESLVFPFLSHSYDIRNGNGGLQPPEIRTCQPGPHSVLDYRKSDAWAAGILLYQIINAYPGKLGKVMEGVAGLLCEDSADVRITCQQAACILHLELFGPQSRDLERLEGTEAVIEPFCRWLLLHASETMAYKAAEWGTDSIVCDLFSAFLSHLTASGLRDGALEWLALK